MLKVGEFYISKDAFDKILHSHIAQVAEEVLRSVGNRLPDNVREQLKGLTEDHYPYAYEYLHAVVRLQTEDFTRSPADIERTEIAQDAAREFRTEADKIIYQMLPAEVRADKSIIDSLSEWISQEVFLDGRE